MQPANILGLNTMVFTYLVNLLSGLARSGWGLTNRNVTGFPE